jgi:4-nitrophenyl phosphatase
VNRKNLARLRAVRGFVLDMDGTLVLGDNRNKGLKPLPGAIEFVQHLADRQIPVAILTNGTTRTPQEYAATLQGLGFAVGENSVLTPSSVAADYLEQRKFKRVMVLGGDGVSQPFIAKGMTVVHPRESSDAEAIFVGWYRDFTMEDIEGACNAVWKGAKLFVASMSMFFATANGRALGTSRIIAASISSVTGARAKILGKPSLEALRSAGRHLGLAPRYLAVVGDDPALEIPMAINGGSLAVAVSTGVGEDGEFNAVPRDRRPHLIVRGVDELLTHYRARPTRPRR